MKQILKRQFDSPPTHVQSSGARLSVCLLIYETFPLAHPLVWLSDKKSAAWLSSPSCEKSPPMPVHKLHKCLLFQIIVQKPTFLKLYSSLHKANILMILC